MIPILVGVLLSYAVASSMALSAYDALIEIKNLPFLPSLSGSSTYQLNAKDLMNENFLYLTKQSKLADIAIIIGKVGSQIYTVPVVESECKKYYYPLSPIAIGHFFSLCNRNHSEST